MKLSQITLDPKLMMRVALNDEINRALAARSAEAWEAIFNDAGVPAGCVLSVKDALRQPQLVLFPELSGRAELGLGGVEGRLIALSHAHDQLTRSHWKSADLREIVGRVA